jgi:hypothetical protein
MYANNLKALLVVLVIALAVFFVIKPVCLRFMTLEAFCRRRNAWFGLTVVSFVSPTFWWYLLFASPIILWAARDEENPVALYLFLAYVTMPLKYFIPAGGVTLIDLSHQRVLALLVLLPWLWRYWRSKDRGSATGFAAVDALVLLFGAVQLASLIPYEPITTTARRAVVFFLDVWIIYYVVARSCSSKEKIIEVMACFCVMCALLAPMALFETLKHWTLYAGVTALWGHSLNTYLLREGVLRASVTTGHSLGLGYFTGIGFGFWLFLRSYVGSRAITAIGVLWMWVGLIAAYSRAPWLMAILLYLSFALLGGGFTRFMRAMLGVACIAAVVMMTPYGDRIVDMLPFVGTVEAKNVTYRQQLIEATWIIVQQNPFFGNPLAAREMDDLINGQGIVDLVNAYAAVALFNGLVGLTLFVAIQGISMGIAFRRLVRFKALDAELSTLGACLLACMLATIFFQATSGFMWMQYVFVGLLLAYASLEAQSKSVREVQPDRRQPVRRPVGQRPSISARR